MQEQATAAFWLSPQQQFIWKLEQEVFQAPTRAACLISLAGPTETVRLRDALERAVSRHEILRTLFRRQTGMKIPFQVVAEQPSIDWSEIDLSGLTGSGRDAKLERTWEAERVREVSSEQAPPNRAVLIKLAAESFSLVVTVPRLCADEASLRVLVQELGTLYAGNEERLAEPLRYVQFAQWQADLLESTEEDAVEARKFWSQSQAGALPVPEWGIERKAADGFQLGLLRAPLAPETATAVLAGGEARLFLLSAWEALLNRLSGQNAFVIGYSAENRGYEELENAIGCFGRTLPLVIRIEKDFRFSDVLRQTTKAVEEAVRFEEYFPPEAIGIETGLIGYTYQELPAREVYGNVGFRLERRQAIGGRFKLHLEVIRRAGDIELAFCYDRSRLGHGSVERVSRYYQNLLASAAAQPETPVSRLRLVDEAERRQLLVEWNQTAADYPHSRCLHQLFGEQAARTPERLAVRCGELTLTYQELEERSNQLAHYLKQHGVGPDRLVGLCLDRSRETMVALLAVLKAGGAYVPLNPDNPPARLEQQLAGAVTLITESKLAPRLPQFAGKLVLIDGDQKLWADQPKSAPQSGAGPDNLVYVIYTSGSTGVPKGVAVRHRNLVNYAHFMTRRLGLEKYPNGLEFATVSTLAADLGNTSIYPALISGGCLHLVRYEMATDPKQFAAYLSRHPVDVLKIVPSHMQALLHFEQAEKLLPRRYLIFGGEALTPKLVNQIESLAPACEILNHYGPTETTVGSLTLKLTEYALKEAQAATIPIGRPIQNTQTYILDGNFEPVPPGVTGELYIAGAGVTAGYLGQPEKTEERFLTNPFSTDPEARMYRTGDLARYLEDGKIEFLGRGDDQVKVRGFRIELGEIESALSAHSAVKQAVVIARDDQQGNRQLVAYVVLRREQAAGAEELRSHLKQQLPDYMVPQAVVLMSKLPLGPNGKLDRKALPEPQEVEREAELVAPRNETETTLLNIWQRVLHREKIGVTDNFFELGGHSLLAVQLMGEIRKETGADIPLAALFQGATIEYLANLVRGADDVDRSILHEIQGQGSKPNFFAAVLPGVNALGYVTLSRHMGQDQPFYMLQASGPGPRAGRRPYSAEEYEKVAASYIHAMRTVQPSGPYYFGGMCEGARIAFEMARLLESEGQKVNLLAIMDTWVIENTQDRKLWRLHYYIRRLQEFRRRPFAVKVQMLEKALKNRLGWWLGTKTRTKSDWMYAYWPDAQYVPSRVESRITIFKAPKQPFYYKKDDLLGWGSRTTSGVDVTVLPNTKHRLLLREPYVRELALALSEAVQRVEAENEPVPGADKDVESAETVSAR
ncbi:MAG: amino acid adenylation domain-containing protein [Acidobacteria bacterium]|nr:amino acid adenylation domain-containing protein [Acidobacteriota bacterium]